MSHVLARCPEPGCDAELGLPAGWWIEHNGDGSHMACTGVVAAAPRSATDPGCPTPAEAQSLATFGRETPISGDAAAWSLHYRRAMRRISRGLMRAYERGDA